jgi:S-adenosylmethionine hydrolase
MDKLITITTDFGDSFAATQLQAVVAGTGYEGKIIENHDVSPFFNYGRRV